MVTKLVASVTAASPRSRGRPGKSRLTEPEKLPAEIPETVAVISEPAVVFAGTVLRRRDGTVGRGLERGVIDLSRCADQSRSGE